MLTPDGNMKPWHDMTADERQNDQMRHFPKMLGRWKGGYARFWSYFVTHQSLKIRIEMAGVKGNLEIRCIANHICGPTFWENSDVQITLEPGLGYVIEDRAAGVRIIADSVDLAENVKPIY